MSLTKRTGCECKLSEDDTFCSKCEQKIEKNQQHADINLTPDPNKQTAHSNTSSIPILVIALIVLAISGILIYLHNNNQSNLNGLSAPPIAVTVIIPEETTAIECAEEEERRTHQDEVNELHGHMRSRIDQVEGVRWIYDRNTPERLDSRGFYLYLGVRGEFVWPRLVMGFQKERWVFFNRVIFNIDGIREEISFSYFEISRDSGGRRFMEYADIPAGPQEDLIKRIWNSERTIIRFAGDQFHYDFEISQRQKDALSRVWRLYELRHMWVE